MPPLTGDEGPALDPEVARPAEAVEVPTGGLVEDRESLPAVGRVEQAAVVVVEDRVGRFHAPHEAAESRAADEHPAPRRQPEPVGRVLLEARDLAEVDLDQRLSPGGPARPGRGVVAGP